MYKRHFSSKRSPRLIVFEEKKRESVTIKLHIYLYFQEATAIAQQLNHSVSMQLLVFKKKKKNSIYKAYRLSFIFVFIATHDLVIIIGVTVTPQRCISKQNDRFKIRFKTIWNQRFTVTSNRHNVRFQIFNRFVTSYTHSRIYIHNCLASTRKANCKFKLTIPRKLDVK